MSNKIDWKEKYMELRSKYINSIDVAFRHGYAEGYEKAKMELMEMQLQQAQEAAAMAAQNPQPQVDGGVPVEEGGEEMGSQEMEGQGNDPLIQSIEELEQYVKNEKKPNFSGLFKSMYKSESSEKKPVEEEDLKKSERQNIINKFFNK
jgi:hypothetical protein